MPARVHSLLDSSLHSDSGKSATMIVPLIDFGEA
jgi:hypothetical protein